MGTLLDKPVTEKEDTAMGECNGLKYGVSGMQGWRVDMEDAHTVVEQIEGVPDHSLFAVFDGHGGQFAAKFAAAHVMAHIAKQPLFTSYKEVTDKTSADAMDMLNGAMRLAFIEVDVSMAETTEIKDRRDRSGCTAIMVMVTPTHIVCANSGDSRSVYCTGGETIPLSYDHKPFHAQELQRIDKAGGYVSMKRVDGDLAVSRALGDFQYKDRPDLPAEEQKVTANPDMEIMVRKETDEFIVISCDGIWDVVENPECVAMVQVSEGREGNGREGGKIENESKLLNVHYSSALLQCTT